MSRCCRPGVYGEFFDEELARRDAEQYRRKGIRGAGRRLVDVIAGRGIGGATVLEIGGGTGTLQIELLEHGAEVATNVELSPGYESEATRLLEEHGLGGRVERRIGDVAENAGLVDAADVVLLHRVVCCYPDADALLAVAAAKAKRLLAFSYPPDNTVARALVALANLWQRLRGSGFRSYVHSEPAMLDAVRGGGFQLVSAERAGVWRIALLERG